MKHVVFQALADAAARGERVALALISGVKGSSPQKVGAKALFYSDGRIHGTLGGGCLEAEIQHRALDALRSGEPATFHLLLDHDFGWDDGLICGGKVFGLILPNAAAVGAKFWSQLAARKSTMTWGVKRDFSITILESETQHADAAESFDERTPSPPQSGGEGRGEVAQTVSSPDLIGKMNTPLSDSPPARSSRGEREETRLAIVPKRAVSAIADKDLLYQEDISPPCELWIAGAGHIAQAVAPLALQLDFKVTVFDDRPALANHNYFPRAVHLRADVWEKLLALTPPDVPSFALIVTRGHRHDALVLKDWIHKQFLFLGMIGSARKARIIFEHFRDEKIATAKQLKRVACPVGIQIKSQSVQEIAVSIMAQYIEKRAELVHVSPVARGELVD